MPPQNGDCKYDPVCLSEAGIRVQASNPWNQDADGFPQQMPPGPPGCATQRLLLPNNHFVCDQNKVATQQQLVNRYHGGQTCTVRRPGYNPDCAVPLWSRNKQGFKGAVPYTGPYDREAPYHYAESPYYMDNDDPRKFFMSGYTGFVPHTQSVIGNVFPLTCNKGLRRFTDLQCNVKQNFCKPVIVSTKKRDFEPPVERLQQCSKEPLRTINIADVGIEYDPTVLRDCGSGSAAGYGAASSAGAIAGSFGSSEADCDGGGGGPEPAGTQQAAASGPDGPRRKMKMFRRKDPHPIYRAEEGLLPTYGGHVPNQQFRFGGTFGRETLNARNLNKRK